jgi:DNA-binding response OmpR family regulator
VVSSRAATEFRPTQSDVNVATDKIQIRRTMLIVDDQNSVRVTLDYLLALDGYRVLLADSGLAAIALAEKEPIDGAMIDINMPVMDGFATCVQLQAFAAKAGRPLRIWFMSGAYSGALKRRGLELGGLDVFSKPFDPSNLSKRLEEGFSPAAAPVPLAAVARPSDGEAEMDSQP